MSFPNKCLIGFSYPAETTTESIQEMLRDISECGEVLACSTVYKHMEMREGVGAQSCLSFVIMFATYLSAEQTLYLLVNNAPNGEPMLLCFNQLVLLNSKLTLPHPELAMHPLTLRCATDVWSQYEHPVLHRTLGELVKNSELKQRAEFLMQGETLIAF